MYVFSQLLFLGNSATPRPSLTGPAAGDKELLAPNSITATQGSSTQGGGRKDSNAAASSNHDHRNSNSSSNHSNSCVRVS